MDFKMRTEKNVNESLALIITDLHLRPEFVEVAYRVLQKAEEEIEIHKPKYLIIGGDTFHTKNRVFASMLTLFGDFLRRVTQKCTVICLVGNHDWGIPYTVHSLQTLAMPNLVIVDKSYRLNDKVGFIGYCREEPRFEELMQPLNGCEILFGHLDLNGFDLGSGWEETDAFCGAERFTSFKKVFSGHFHKAQEKILANGTEFIYVGTGYTTDFNESDQEKRFMLINLETGEWKGIPTNLTLHRTIRINATDPLPEIKKEDLDNGVNFRVIITGTKEQIGAFRIPIGYPAKIVNEFKSSDAARLDINASDNHENMMEKYVGYELKRIYGEEGSADIDQEKLMRIGRGLLARSGSK
jgi:DNA repair exonuclease SbcCD nuclease subunit